MKARNRKSVGGDKPGETVNAYNAEGSPAMKVAMEDKPDGFKRGGKVKGKEPKKRLDRRARGGAAESKHMTKEHEMEGGKLVNKMLEKRREEHAERRARGGRAEHEEEHKEEKREMERKEDKKEERKEKRDHRPRMAAGGSPYSAAHKQMNREEGREGSGHEGEMPGRSV